MLREWTDFHEQTDIFFIEKKKQNWTKKSFRFHSYFIRYKCSRRNYDVSKATLNMLFIIYIEAASILSTANVSHDISTQLILNIWWIEWSNVLGCCQMISRTTICKWWLLDFNVFFFLFHLSVCIDQALRSPFALFDILAERRHMVYWTVSNDCMWRDAHDGNQHACWFCCSLFVFSCGFSCCSDDNSFHKVTFINVVTLNAC